jgi:hypothetical protein
VVELGHAHRDATAVRVPEHVGRAVRPDQRGDVVGDQIGLQLGVPGRPAAPAQVEEDHVPDVPQRGRRQQIGVVPARAAVHDDQHRQRRVTETAHEQVDVVDALGTVHATDLKGV